MKRIHSHEEVLKALEESGGIRAEAARRLKISTRSLFSTIDQMKAAGLEVPDSSYRGHPAGTSTLYGPDGEVKLEWVKRNNKPGPEDFAKAVRDAMEGVKPAARIPKPKLTRKDLLVVYPIGDQHVGMYSWHVETGDDYDIKISERLLSSAISHLVDVSPQADEALIIDVGDFAHYDNIKAETVRSHNTLDSDSRYHMMIRSVIRLLCTCIESALVKHRKVSVICTPGNHNDMGAAWMVEALSMHYQDNPRVDIFSRAGKFQYYEFGKVLLGVTHGDTGKPEKMHGVMAADVPEMWGRTKHRHWLTGHIHHKTSYEFPGVTWETFRTLASRDAWQHGQGYRSGRDMTSIVYHREFGEVGRNRFDLSMLK